MRTFRDAGEKKQLCLRLISDSPLKKTLEPDTGCKTVFLFHLLCRFCSCFFWPPLRDGEWPCVAQKKKPNQKNAQTNHRCDMEKVIFCFLPYFYDRRRREK